MKISELFLGVGQFKSRITIDLDSKSKLKLLYYVYKGIKIIPKLVGIKIMPSTSKGWHIIFYSNERMSMERIFKYREKLGDDKLRIYYSKKERPRQILFQKKLKRKRIKWLK